MGISELKNQPPSAPLGSERSFGRVIAVGAVLAVVVGLFLYAGGWFTRNSLTPASLVDTFERLDGVHSGFRRNHAKGVCVTGYFESNGQGQSISMAQVFRPGRTPIVGRFAFAGGDPNVDDGPATVRSLAILFQQPNREEWRTAMINIPVFLVNTPEAFAEFLVASAPSTAKQDPDAMKNFLAKHPETAAALQEIGKHPFSSGFGDSSYHALNAFRFVNANGTSTPVRWSVIPDQTFTANDSAAKGKSYLFDALIAQVHSMPLRWHLVLTVGQPGDPTAEAAHMWPPDRRQIDAGTLTIETIESEDTSPTRDINFDPLVLPAGIEASDDPILSTRSAAYSVSFRRRESERKVPSAISPAEVQK